MSDVRTQSVVFPELLDRPVWARFDEPATSVDGGAVLLSSLDRELGLTERLAGSVRDSRQPGKVVHGLVDLVRQRVFGLALGYADCNDARSLREDPIHKLLLERDPLSGVGLADPSTLSRFENAVGRTDLVRMGSELMDVVIEHNRRRPGARRVRRITIDLDPTEDPTHGQQQLALFNGHYGSWCFLPLLAFVTFDEEPEQQLVAAILRGGRAHASLGALPLLRRLLPRLREAFPRARLRIRLDGGFAGPELLDFLEEERLEYVVAVAGNSVLKRRVEPLMRKARRASKTSGRTETLFGETRYAARSWCRHERRVVLKAEITRLDDRSPRDNARFVVTNLRHTPENVYQIYRERGDTENRIKELKNDLALDRTSCRRFLANQLRVLLTAAAYVLFQQLRLRLARRQDHRSTVATLRQQLLKIAARVERSARRVLVHFAASHAWAAPWLRLARSCGAAPS
ncbi:MAG: IS1380 family transposase [bacterium]|jgi:DNA-directed RNA polymerase subunit N (RpoN/RPB10)|uniref:IS1380 family transposase n=1 Tax=Candidatus Methylomirabilis tolerans TaxID=3123416 RepID=A0AAJ1AGU9_9BACT|nr:IS1380 family transposase [Candidatus Methylomirabilis sp.]